MAKENQKTFNAPMDPTKPLVLYAKKQEHCQAFVADASNPITMADSIMQDAYHD